MYAKVVICSVNISVAVAQYWNLTGICWEIFRDILVIRKVKVWSIPFLYARRI